MNPRVGERRSARTQDGLPQGDRPPILEQCHYGHCVRWNDLGNRPGLLTTEKPPHFANLGASARLGFNPFFPGRSDSNESSRHGAQLADSSSVRSLALTRTSSPLWLFAMITMPTRRTISKSRRRRSSGRMSPWNLRSSKPTTTIWTGPNSFRSARVKRATAP